MKAKTVYLSKLYHCPYCSTPLDAHGVTGKTDDGEPQPLDVTICYKCFEIIIFDEDLEMQKPTQQQIATLKESPELYNHVQELIASFKNNP